MKHRYAFLILLTMFVQIPGARGGEFDALLTRIPAAANTLVLIDVETVLASPVAIEEGWGKRLEMQYVERPIYLPPEATKLVAASSLRATESFTPNWQVAAMELSEPMSMRSIARAEGGYIDKIGGFPVAWTPSDAYFTSLGENELDVMFPADRQYFSRWIDHSQDTPVNNLSDYLKTATSMANSKVPMIIAIDLKDVAHPHEIYEKVQDSELLKKNNIAVADATSVLASLQGAVLRVAIGKDVQGQLRIDFGQSIAPIKSIAKEVVVSSLGELGAPVEELSGWKLELEDMAITMRGKLSEEGQRRVFSIIEIPSTKFSELKTESMESSEGPSESKMREASLAYYHSVQVLFRDLRRDMTGNKAVAAVMERYARQIDRMPILNVDEELLDYGANVANILRSVALSKRQGGIQAGTQTAGMGYGSYTVGYYGNTVDARNSSVYSAKERSSIKAQAMAESKNARVEGKKMIEESTAQIRRKMTQKYGVEFK